MAKSSKAKKAKKADFAKVKLKVGRRLKKAQNETRTDFKARKIILKEQLVKKTDETLLTKKKHNIKELLSRLSHSSVFVRQDGVNGLTEIVKKNETTVVEPHLPTLIQGVAPCIFDTDNLIRASAIKFMESLILKVGTSIEPYFNLVATHLSCAMVHLNISVQGDSLKLMKVLIRNAPALIARHANTLLKNFINLISRKASSAHMTSGNKPDKLDFTRVLHVNPNNNLTAQKWRLQLLKELSSFLEAILREQRRVQAQVPYTLWQTIVQGSVPPVVCGDLFQSNLQETGLFSDPQQLEKFCLSIVPLLFQVWAECDPKGSNENAGGNSLCEEGVETLICIVNIIMHLWNLTQLYTSQHPMECGWFRAQLQSQNMSRIISGFPYYCCLTVQQKKKKLRQGAVKLQPGGDYNLRHCDDLNVSLAHLTMQLSSSKSFEEKAVNFLSKLLRDGNRDGQYNLGAVVKILLDLLQTVPKSQAESLINAAQICYSHLHPLKKDRALLLKILLDATDVDHLQLWDCGSINMWVEQVVDDLVRGDVREAVLDAVIVLRLRDNTKLKQLVLARKDEIKEKIQSKGVQEMIPSQVNKKLQFLLKE